MPNYIRDGLECRFNTITEDGPVQFHEHNFGHWLTCAQNLIDVETERSGRIRMLPGEVLWVEAKEKHRLTAPAGPAKYSCVGKEGL